MARSKRVRGSNSAPGGGLGSASRVRNAKSAPSASGSVRGGGVGAKGTPSSSGDGKSISANPPSPASTAAGRKSVDGAPQSTGSYRKVALAALKNHVPAHTFASTTMPRMRQPGASAPMPCGPDGNSDPNDMRSGKAGARLSATVPEPSNEMAAPKGMIKPSRKGLFTSKAKAAGMSVQAYAAKVLQNPGSHDPQTVKQANFARNFGGAAKKGGKS